MAKPKVMDSNRESVCMKCCGHIGLGEKIIYQYGVGAVHLECPENPLIELSLSFIKVGESWCVRYVDPEDASAHVGEVVTIVTGKGTVREAALGEIVQVLGPHQAVYKSITPGEESRVITVTDAGVYETPEGDVYIVKPGKESGNLYAKKLVKIGGKRLTVVGEVENIDFIYERGAIYRITPEMRMPLERAQQLTILYARCIVCGAHLKDENSVRVGMGKVCQGKYFVPPSTATQYTDLDPNPVPVTTGKSSLLDDLRKMM